MSKLSIIVKQEYLTDVRSKSFWIGTLVVPLLMVLFGVVMGMLLSDSDTAMKVNNSFAITPDEEEMTPLKAIGLVCGIFLSLFLMMYGAKIFQKVRVEKTNRIVEILATCVPGRTMMLAKVIAVGLIGLTQLALYAVLIGVAAYGLIVVFSWDVPWGEILQFDYIMAVVWSLLYFIGGYVFFGSMYACAGAFTDKNNENQEYMAILTFILLASFYIGEYAVDHGSSAFVRVCALVPFTSPTIGAVNAITQSVPVWESLAGLAILYVCGWFTLALSGKIYTSSIMLKGKKLTFKDIITFIKAR